MPALLECPKHMEYGPCGGVEFDGTCEVSPHRCVFLDLPTVRWHGVASVEPAGHSDPVPAAPVSSGAVEMRALMATRPVVVADFPARALDAASIAECGAILAGRVDAVLAGDAGSARVQFPPAYRASLIRAAGLQVWTGFNCRDRNRVAMEGELAALAHVGVAGVHCVTGDHTSTGQRPDATPVFDLDSTEAASLARANGHLVSVAEAPATPPVDRRPDRLLEKFRAGAEVCFVNHAGGAAPVASFVARAQDLGATMAFIPCIPVVVDRESAELLRTFTTLVLPDGYLERILDAADPFAAGIAAAVELGREFLAIDGVTGVNLSGGAGPGREAWFAEALGRISDELR
ncbi:MAG: methylenetetrahydrofolate reductase C-terminal domain-containing protein [Actinobacteria bacterium]|nr:methylenetetrahydrofolate reductase C-terminal domain-containing protein [Actinomycetota bacterium]